LQKLFIALRYLSYWLNATDEHSLHSPFMFELYTTVIKPDKHYYCFPSIEKSRRAFLKNNSAISITELGAGSVVTSAQTRKISSIAKHSLSPEKFSKLLFRLMTFTKPKTVVELGTSLGINTLYMAYYHSQTTVYTFEGCSQLAQQAKNLFNKHLRRNIHLIEGNIDNTLTPTLKKLPSIDLIYIDANHKHTPTLSYFNQCLEKSHPNTLIIIDDIHWSKEMEQAWEDIKQHPMVTCTVDIFEAGLVFLLPQPTKQHYTLSF
jgi:predicted O-methyltransferase YrrM